MRMYQLFVSLLLLFIYPYNVSADEIEGRIRVSGGFFPISTSFTGEVNIAGNTLSISPTAIFGSPYTTLTSELLTPGTYTRTHNLSSGGSITRSTTIPQGTLGAYFVISINSTEHQLFNAWDVSVDGLSFSNRPIPGDVWVGSPYDGRSLYYDFAIVPPFSEVTIQALGGGVHECSEASGATITLDSNPTTAGIAVLERVEWTVDGVLIGQGASITEYFSLGTHIVEATAITTAGETATDSINVDITDTLSPLLQIIFLNTAGNPVTSAASGDYTVQYNASDICDPTPGIIGSATPVMTIYDGDVISIDGTTGNVALPTTAVEVSANATDASGNTATDNKILIVE